MHVQTEKSNQLFHTYNLKNFVGMYLITFRLKKLY